MAKPIKFIKKRRYCKIAGCKSLLSMYNFSDYCHVHQLLALTKEKYKEPSLNKSNHL